MAEPPESSKPQPTLQGEVIKETKSLVKPIYDDLGHPVVKEVGEVAGQAVRLLLSPLRVALSSGNKWMDRLEKGMAKKLEGVPSDRLLPPPTNIAGQAAWNYMLLGDGNDNEEALLRSMYESLLARASDKETRSSVHPSFVTIISQLSPEEARMLMSIDISRAQWSTPYAEIRLSPDPPIPGIGWTYHGDLCDFGLDLGIPEEKAMIFVGNLISLGLLEVPGERHITDDKSYAALEARLRSHEWAQKNPKCFLGKKMLSLTDKGASFIKTCVK